MGPASRRLRRTINWAEGDPLARAPLLQTDPSQVGRYRLVARLGAGGMGVVYLGVDPTGHQVAVKVLRPSWRRSRSSGSGSAARSPC